MRIVTLNVRGEQTSAMLEYLAEQTEVDLLVVSEYRVRESGDRMGAALAQAGLVHQLASRTPVGERGVLVASREPIEWADDEGRINRGALSEWAVAARIPSVGLHVLGVYVSCYDVPERYELLEQSVEYAKRHRERPYVIAGDFNSFEPSDAETGNHFGRKWIRALRETAVDVQGLFPPPAKHELRYTHFKGRKGAKKGSRMDFVFVGPSLREAVTAAYIDHEPLVQRLTDHAAVVADVAIGAKKPIGGEHRETDRQPLPASPRSGADAYERALRALSGRLTDKQRDMLRFHFSAPRREVTPREMAQHVGYATLGAANLQYGLLAKALCLELGWEPAFKVEAFAEVQRDPRRGGELVWRMRPELAQALKRLGWVSDVGAAPDGA